MDGLDGYAPFRIISRMAFSDSGSDSFREIEVRYHRHFHHYQSVILCRFDGVFLVI